MTAHDDRDRLTKILSESRTCGSYIFPKDVASGIADAILASDWLRERDADKRADCITVPRPHVPYGPKNLTEDQSDVRYLREAARDLANHYQPFGSNLRATVVKLLLDAAEAIEAGDPDAQH